MTFRSSPRLRSTRRSIPASSLATPSARRWHWLPAPNTWKYHALLATVGLCVLGPLGGLAASYMNFSIGFYVSGQVLAGILGSTVTFGYGADGKHGANYIQTIAASVAQMSAMAVVLQAMVNNGDITQQQADFAYQQPLVFHRRTFVDLKH